MTIYIAFDQSNGNWGVNDGETAYVYNRNRLESHHAPLDFWLQSCNIWGHRIIQIEVEELTIDAIFKVLPELAL